MKLSLFAPALGLALALSACSAPTPRSDGSTTTVSPASMPSGADPALAAFIAKIRAVDNHTHINSTAPGDTDADALPLDGIPAELPAPLRPDNPAWLAAYKALYQYPHAELSEAHAAELKTLMRGVAQKQGDTFPTWALDQVGTEVAIANRIAMGPGLPAPRFRWASYADALMLPFPPASGANLSPDRAKLFALEETLLQRYFTDLKIASRPATLDAYLKTVVTPTLEAQRKGGCVALKFEAAYLRALDFDDVAEATASRVYAMHARNGAVTAADDKALQDYLFRYIAREAGRLGMAVHIHSFEGFGNTYSATGADPALLESVFNDPALAKTRFVIVHGGGVFADHAGAQMWKPNVYVDISMLTLAYPPARLAEILRQWLTQFPEKVLFGSDAVTLGPDMGWEVSAWVAGHNGRDALTRALTGMLRDGEITMPRAEAIATMVMRTNASALYGLDLK